MNVWYGMMLNGPFIYEINWYRRIALLKQIYLEIFTKQIFSLLQKVPVPK